MSNARIPNLLNANNDIKDFFEANYKNNFNCFCLDKQQEVDINNLRLSEDDSHQRSKGNGRGKIAPPLSQISGVKKPLGHTNSFSGSKLPEYGVESKHPEDLAQVQCRTLQYSTRQCSSVQYSTVQYSTWQYSTVQYSAVQYSTVQYSTVQYSMYSTVQYHLCNLLV